MLQQKCYNFSYSLGQITLKNKFLKSKRFLNWINKAYLKVTLPKTDCGILVTGMLFVAQDNLISFMTDTFDIYFPY